MNLKVGQRWLWKFGTYSEVILEITQIGTKYYKDQVEVLYVQIIKKGFIQDFLGNKDNISITRFSAKTSTETFIYLEGQDKTI